MESELPAPVVASVQSTSRLYSICKYICHFVPLILPYITITLIGVWTKDDFPETSKFPSWLIVFGLLKSVTNVHEDIVERLKIRVLEKYREPPNETHEEKVLRHAKIRFESRYPLSSTLDTFLCIWQFFGAVWVVKAYYNDEQNPWPFYITLLFSVGPLIGTFVVTYTILLLKFLAFVNLRIVV